METALYNLFLLNQQARETTNSLSLTIRKVSNTIVALASQQTSRDFIVLYQTIDWLGFENRTFGWLDWKMLESKLFQFCYMGVPSFSKRTVKLEYWERNFK